MLSRRPPLGGLPAEPERTCSQDARRQQPTKLQIKMVASPRLEPTGYPERTGVIGMATASPRVAWLGGRELVGKTNLSL
jgi:hypothetical protein